MNLRLAEAAAISCDALDRSLVHDAELSLHAIEDEGVLLGAFQRLGEADGFHSGVPRYRRISGGAHLYIAKGSLHLVLALPQGPLLSDPSKIVNRLVRPLLRVCGAAYFGRDAFVREKKPIGFAGFAHDAASGRAVLEAVIPASADWSDPSRASYRGADLGAIAAPQAKAAAIVELYLSTFAGLAEVTALSPPASSLPDATPWATRIEEAIGPIYAGPNTAGDVEIGGELMASRDALAALVRDVAALPDPRDAAAVGAAVERAFSGGNAVLFGVRSLPNVRDLLVKCFEMRPGLTV